MRGYNQYNCIRSHSYKATLRSILIASSLLLLSWMDCSAQVYLQLEKAHSLKTWRFQNGDRITFQTQFYPGKWQSGKILQVLPEDNAVFFEDRIVHVKDFTKIQFKRPFVDGLGTNVMRFGVGWFAFAGIIEAGRSTGVLETDYRFGTDTAIIGGTAILSGYLTKILWGKVVRQINDKNRIRIIDTRF